MMSGLQRLLWCRFSWRHIRLAPVSSLLLVIILALGVAVYFSIRLANRAAVSSFQNFTDILTAESDGLISAPAGSLPEQTLAELRTTFAATPVHIVAVLETTSYTILYDFKRWSATSSSRRVRKSALLLLCVLDSISAN